MTETAKIKREKTIRWEDPKTAAQAGRNCSGMELFRKIKAGEISPAPISQLIGATFESFEEGKFALRLIPDESHYNPIGTVHGGIIATLLDSVMSCAVHTMLPKGRVYTTLEIKVNYLRPISIETGPVLAQGNAIHVGRKSGYAEGRIIDSAGKIYAMGSATCLVFEI